MAVQKDKICVHVPKPKTPLGAMLAMCECLRVVRGSESLILALCCPLAKWCQTHYERPVSRGLLSLLQDARDVSVSSVCEFCVGRVSERSSCGVLSAGLCWWSLCGVVECESLWGF